MHFQLVPLPGPMVLVLGRDLLVKTHRKTSDHPSLPADPNRWHTDLHALLRTGVPATFRAPSRGGRGDWSLLLHVESYVLRLYPRTHTDRRTGRAVQDAYTLGDVSPRRLRDHDDLAKGGLLLRPTQWVLLNDPRDIRQGSSSFWSQIVGARQQLEAQTTVAAAAGTGTSAPEMVAHHGSFLDRLDRMNDAAQDIATAEERKATYPYALIDATGERRKGTQAIYDFRLVGGRAPDVGIFVQISGEPERRGRVTRVTGTTATIAFDTRVDFDRLPPQGELEATPSQVVFQKEREAVNLLRTGQSRNTGLLAALVDGQVRRLVPASTAPTIALDDDQTEALRKAVATDDIVLIQGPPGTGKTRTISQVASACAAVERKVLVTSHTNRAVDNVLERLPKDLLAVRVGNDGKVTAAGRPFLLEQQITDLRDQVANRVGRSLLAYDHLDHARHWMGQLSGRIDELGGALDDEARAQVALDAARQAVGGPAQARVTAVKAQRADLAAALTRSREEITALSRRREQAGARAGWPLLGRSFERRARRLDDRMATSSQRSAQLQRTYADCDRELAEAMRELEAATVNDPQVQAANQALQTSVARRYACLGAACDASKEVQRQLGKLVTAPPVTTDGQPAVIRQELVALRDWAISWLPLLATRRDLLRDWSDQVAVASDDLGRELVRYAQVIAATAIGAASRPEVAEVEFDLAIVDEAGQIGVADALVPLVRARRGLLVGDHMQLPPFLDSEVEAWGSRLGDPAVRELLSKSAFELLAAGGRLPRANLVPLRCQRRMPPSIASFISETFYDGWLTSKAEEGRPDDVFRRSLVLVDTSGLPPERRHEASGRQRERWGQTGYANEAEADLLVELAALYHRLAGGDAWAVIVPYRAQVAAITGELGKRIGAPTVAELNVGTVDAFQGGEREFILYGFTRSNPDGQIGFLKELRRANVAFTRAKRRLVLVGDLSTLLNARDPKFRTLAQSLHAHAGRHGEIRRYDDVAQSLERLDAQGVRS
jgi:hypothetical protein